MLKTRKGSKTRPLSARVKNSLFEIMESLVFGSLFYDFFAGGGSVGLEALSRGAHIAHFIEKNTTCIRIIRENLKKCGFEKKAQLHQKNALKLIPLIDSSQRERSLAFLGPPYGAGLAHLCLSLLAERGDTPPFSLVVAELRKGETLHKEYGSYKMVREQFYGETRLAFFKTREFS